MRSPWDGNGVGPEILLKAYVQGELQGEYMVWGDRGVLEYCSRKLGYEIPFHFAKDETDYCPDRLNVLDLGWLTEDDLTPGQVNAKVAAPLGNMW